MTEEERALEFEVTSLRVDVLRGLLTLIGREIKEEEMASFERKRKWVPSEKDVLHFPIKDVALQVKAPHKLTIARLENRTFMEYEFPSIYVCKVFGNNPPAPLVGKIICERMKYEKD